MPRLSKAEKKALKELKKLQRAAAVEEARRNVKRKELAREIEALELRRSEVEKKWRQCVLEIKRPLFRQDVQVFWTTFERAYDQKDYIIDHLQDLIRVADNQYQRAEASFCDAVDRTILKFGEDLDRLQQEGVAKVENLMALGAAGSAKLEAEKDYVETHLQLVTYQSDKLANEKYYTTKGINIVKADDEREKLEQERDLLKFMCERLYFNVWEEFKAVIKHYVQSTAENRKLNNELRKKEVKILDIIAAQGKQLISHKATTKRLQTELSGIEDEIANSDFADSRERHRAAYKRLRELMFDGLKQDSIMLDRLVNDSGRAVNVMSEANEKGERILRIAALCRKLERKFEKVLPLGLLGPLGRNLPAVVESRVSIDSFYAELMHQSLSEIGPLENLWERTARVKLIKAALQKEKTQLVEEINAMKTFIRMKSPTLTITCTPVSAPSSLPRPATT